jgi:hypothetical protein
VGVKNGVEPLCRSSASQVGKQLCQGVARIIGRCSVAGRHFDQVSAEVLDCLLIQRADRIIEDVIDDECPGRLSGGDHEECFVCERVIQGDAIGGSCTRHVFTHGVIGDEVETIQRLAHIAFDCLCGR